MYDQDKNPITLYLSVLIGFAVVISMLSIGYDLDNIIAKAVYDPNANWAWLVRQYSNIPGIILSLIAIFTALIPFLRNKNLLMRRVVIVWLSGLIVGGGLITHLLIKENVDRPRPRQELLVEKTVEIAKQEEATKAQSAKIKGKSFPSGHVAMAIMFAVPFFPLRRRKPKLAYSALVFGLAYAGVVGYARMTLGAHFLTDVVWAIAIVLSTAAITSRYVTEDVDFKARYFAPLLIILAIGGILINRFTVEIRHTSETNDVIAHIPCRHVEFSEGDKFNLSVTVKGFGAPISNIKLKEEDETISLVRHKGLYRNLKCSANITLPAGRSVWISTDKYVVNPHQFPVRVRGSHAIYYGK